MHSHTLSSQTPDDEAELSPQAKKKPGKQPRRHENLNPAWPTSVAGPRGEWGPAPTLNERLLRPEETRPAAGGRRERGYCRGRREDRRCRGAASSRCIHRGRRVGAGGDHRRKPPHRVGRLLPQAYTPHEVISKHFDDANIPASPPGFNPGRVRKNSVSSDRVSSSG